MTRKARVDRRPDGTPHIIDDNGRTCTVGGDYHDWSHYRALPKGKHGHTARCKACTSKIAGKKSVERRKKVADSVLTSPMNIFLMMKWNKYPSFCDETVLEGLV